MNVRVALILSVLALLSCRRSTNSAAAPEVSVEPAAATAAPSASAPPADSAAPPAGLEPLSGVAWIEHLDLDGGHEALQLVGAFSD